MMISEYFLSSVISCNCNKKLSILCDCIFLTLNITLLLLLLHFFEFHSSLNGNYLQISSRWMCNSFNYLKVDVSSSLFNWIDHLFIIIDFYPGCRFLWRSWKILALTYCRFQLFMLSLIPRGRFPFLPPSIESFIYS